MKRLPSLQFMIPTLILLSVAFTPLQESYWDRQLREHGKMNLPVRVLRQSEPMSCGEAAITMAYNYAFPEARITEEEVIDFAAGKGYYTERNFPFTSPDDMVRIADHYAANTVSTDWVKSADEGLSLLTEKLTGGDPVIIDIVTRLDDLDSGAHFVVITGLEYDPANLNGTKILYNDPRLGRNLSSNWLGVGGIWNAWQNNGDPDGSGWWMVIASP